ncbi:hypothetical protein ABZ215_42120, partial [Amycolatopsis sp. NPDC006131]
WAAYRAGHACVREALDAPVPSGHGFRSALPPPPWGHPDFVLARAVAEGAISAAEAELIGATRLEGVPLVDAAAQRDMSYQAVKKARQRAERRLVAYLLDDAPAAPGESDLATQVADTMTITNAIGHADLSRGVTDLRKKNGASVSPRDASCGVQRCGTRPASRAHTTPLPEQPQRRPGSTPGEPRCA